jgi:hypothetical protein
MFQCKDLMLDWRKGEKVRCMVPSAGNTLMTACSGSCCTSSMAILRQTTEGGSGEQLSSIIVKPG